MKCSSNSSDDCDPRLPTVWVYCTVNTRNGSYRVDDEQWIHPICKPCREIADNPDHDEAPEDVVALAILSKHIGNRP